MGMKPAFPCKYMNCIVDKTTRTGTYKNNYIKSALSGLRKILAIESPLKMKKNAFYFISKALFVPKIFKFLSRLFGHVAKQLN